MGRLTRISILSSFLYLSSFMWAYITERIFSQPSLFLSFSQETVGYLILFALAMASIGVFASAVALLIRPLLLAFGIEAFTALFKYSRSFLCFILLHCACGLHHYDRI